ncbi:MAG: nucleotide sugar dehydrogenase [Proteobacteria bacterium]|nr:nucleotide sugar dehydrogenase [Pseudomonadota bacterium]
MKYEAGIVGGCGHAGLPLALVLAGRGLPVLAFDTDATAVEIVRAGRMPFLEEGGPEALESALASGNLAVTDKPGEIGACGFVILVVGGEDPDFLLLVLEGLIPHLSDGQVLVLRSTVMPGTTEKAARLLAARGLHLGVACCPERIAQGRGVLEIPRLPQIVSALDPETLARVGELFLKICPSVKELPVAEAEFAKLMTNAWRYIRFAAANQFHALAGAAGMDFHRILVACQEDYPRLDGVAGPGFAAGPCLEKDTRMMAAWMPDAFPLGMAALSVNQSMPEFLVDRAAGRLDLSSSVAGILGMAFKAGSDDPRHSLSYRLRDLLASRCREVLCTDPLVQDPDLVPMAEVLARADVLFVGAPHQAYHGLAPRPGTLVLDPWGILGREEGA